jgi:hypothetical protein
VSIGRANALASLWGFAEATVFFIVPDVQLSWLALRSPKRGLIACLFALLGALIGGSAMWMWGRFDPDAARAIFESLPAISGATIASVRQQFADSGIAGLILGPLRGTPYKIYAVEAADLGHGLAIFLAVSIPARLIRFVLVTIVAGAVSWTLRRRVSLRTVQSIHVLFWTVFYVWFFTVMADS